MILTRRDLVSYDEHTSKSTDYDTNCPFTGDIGLL